MKPRIIGARIRAVTKRTRSTALGLLDSAAAPVAAREGSDGSAELLGGEVRPERIRDVELGVGDLPEQEVRDPQLPAGADHEVHLRCLWCVEVGGEGGLVDLFRLYATLHHASGGVHDLRPAAVVERDVDLEPVIIPGEPFCLLDSRLHIFGQVPPAPEETQLRATLV